MEGGECKKGSGEQYNKPTNMLFFVIYNTGMFTTFEEDKNTRECTAFMQAIHAT